MIHNVDEEMEVNFAPGKATRNPTWQGKGKQVLIWQSYMLASFHERKLLCNIF